MGFRSRRRHKGGGGGGGGGSGQAFAWTGEANGLQPGDDVGNRKSFRPVVVPPEDIGNRKEADEEDDIPNDDAGNRIEMNPTHEVSGVLLSLDPKKRKGRAKSTLNPQERVGRYVVGGVNPLIAGGMMRPPQPTEDVGDEGEVRSFQRPDGEHGDRPERGERPERSERKQRRFDSPDGVAAQEVSPRRAQRFFDFDEDDRFEYVLKSTPEEKRTAALRFVDDVLREAGRDAVVEARVIEDADKPKLLVTIEERGPHAQLPPERVPEGAQSPLFIMGNAALMSLNYIANKVINRYPDDRIRLAVLPKADEPAYLESLEEHRRLRGRATAPIAPAAPAAPAAPTSIEPAVAPTAAPVAAPVAAAVDAAAEPAAAEAPAPRRRGRKPKASGEEQTLLPEPAAEAPVVAAPTPAPAPVADVAPAPPVTAPAPPPVAAPAPAAPTPRAARMPQEEAPRAGRSAAGGRRRAGRADEVVPPPSAYVPEPEAPATVEEEEPVRQSGWRAAPLPEEPSTPARMGSPRPRPRRGGPSLVEVVRVTKKT